MDSIDDFLYACNDSTETTVNIWKIVGAAGKDEESIVEEQKKILNEIKKRKKEQDDLEASDRSFAIELLSK